MSFANSPWTKSGLLVHTYFSCSQLWRASRIFTASPSQLLARSATRARGSSPETVSISKAFPPSPKLPPPNGRAPGPATPQKMKTQYLAQRMVSAGETVLYTAPSHTGFLMGTFLAGSMCFFGVGVMFLNMHWKGGAGLPWFVPVANRIGMFFMTFMGGWIVLRASRHITSISLLPQANDVKLLVTVRRTIPLPFVRPRKMVIDPSDIILPSRMVAQLAIPTWADSEGIQITGNASTRMIKRTSIALWTLFAGTRKVFTHEGFMDVTINGESGLWKLDTAGKFARGGRSLTEIVSFEA